MEEKRKVSPVEALDLEFQNRKAEFQAVLPANCTFERFNRIVKTAIVQNSELMVADRASLFMSCFKCAQDGLVPDGREAALVIYSTRQKDSTYKKMVQYMPMFGGILKKIRNSGELASISSHVVYKNDEFDYCLGDDEHITHKPTIADPGEPICAYAIVKTKDNAIYREVMTVAEIEKIRGLSSAEKIKKKFPDTISIWDQHWGEMAKKTVIRRISKRLPMSTDLEQVIHRDDDMFDFDNKVKPTNNIIDNINNQVIDIELSQDHPPITDADFGAVGDGVTDDTAAIQAIANYKSIKKEEAKHASISQ